MGWTCVNKQYCPLNLIFTKLFVYWLQAAFLEACQAAKNVWSLLESYGGASHLKTGGGVTGRGADVAFCKDLLCKPLRIPVCRLVRGEGESWLLPVLLPAVPGGHLSPCAPLVICWLVVQLAVGFCPSLPVGTSDGNHCQSDNKTCQIRSAKFWPFIKEQTHIFSQQQLKILFLLQGRKMDLLLALNWQDSKSKVTCRCTSNINKPFTSADAACPYTLALDRSTSSFEILPLPASPLSLFPCNLSMLERVNIMLKLTKNYSPKGGKNVPIRAWTKEWVMSDIFQNIWPVPAM